MYRQIQQAYARARRRERRREYDRGAGAENRASVEAGVAFAGFDFSAPAEGPLAATFSELFADVFQDAAREATTPTRGADLELERHRVVSRRGPRAPRCRCRSRAGALPDLRWARPA